MSSRPLSIGLILVLVNQSEEVTRAMEYTTTTAAEYDVAIHAVHILDENVIRTIEQDVISKDAVAEDSKVITDTVSALAETADVSVTMPVAYGFSRTSKLRHPDSVVLDTAEELDADFIVVPREPVSGNPGEVLTKAAEYVLLYAGQPVLSV